MFEDFAAADDDAGPVHEVGEDAFFLGGEREAAAFVEEAPLQGVVGQRTDLQHGIGVAVGAAQQGTQAQYDFFKEEGFGEEVVCAGAESGELVAPAAASGKDKHGETAPFFAPVGEQRHAVHAGQAEVKHGGIVVFGAAEEGGIVALVREFDNHAGLAQVRSKALRQFAIVFDYQHPHQRTSISSSLRMWPLNGSSDTSTSIPLSSCKSTS